MRIGFIVNPIAGMGGKVGLKGTDDVEEAIKRGAEPVAYKKAIEAMNGIDCNIVTCSSIMGEDYLDGNIEIVYKVGEKTTAEDTRKACKKFLKNDIDLIVFVGGDGTACDVYSIIGKKIPILGIPSGVKMYSGVFAINAKSANNLLKEFIDGKTEIVKREIMDIDEKAYRKNILKAKFFGMARCPLKNYFLQNGKKIFLCKKGMYILGPGSTLKKLEII